MKCTFCDKELITHFSWFKCDHCKVAEDCENVDWHQYSRYYIKNKNKDKFENYSEEEFFIPFKETWIHIINRPLLINKTTIIFANNKKMYFPYLSLDKILKLEKLMIFV